MEDKSVLYTCALEVAKNLTDADIITWSTKNEEDQKTPFLTGMRNNNNFWLDICHDRNIPVYDPLYAKKIFQAEFLYKSSDKITAAKKGSFNGMYDIFTGLINDKKYSQVFSYFKYAKRHGIPGYLICLNVLKKGVMDQSVIEHHGEYCQKGLELVSLMAELINDQNSFNYIKAIGWQDSFNKQCQPSFDKFIERMQKFFQGHLNTIENNENLWKI